MANDIAIRPARLSDYPAVAALLTEATRAHVEEYPNPYFLENIPPVLDEAGFKRLIDGEKAIVFMAETEGEKELAGVLTATMERVSSTAVEGAHIQADIDDLVVHPRFRRAGVGTALLAEVKTWAAGRQATRLHVSSYTDDAGSLEFYRRHGFQPWTVDLLLDLKSDSE